MSTKKTSKEPSKRKSRASKSQSAQPQAADSRVTKPHAPRKKRTGSSKAQPAPPLHGQEAGVLSAELPHAEPSSPIAASPAFVQSLSVVAPNESTPQSLPEQDETMPPKLTQITAWYIDTAQRFAHNALTLQKQTLIWGQDTPWGPLLETQHAWTSQWVARMTALSRTFWQLESAGQDGQTQQPKAAEENAL